MSQDPTFIKMMDMIVEISHYDNSVKEMIAWLDKTDMFGNNLSFYDKAAACIKKHREMKKQGLIP